MKYNNSIIIYIDELIKKEYLEENIDIDKYCIKSIMVTGGIFYNKYTINKDCNDKELINDSIS